MRQHRRHLAASSRRGTALPPRRSAASLIALPGIALLGLGLLATAAPAAASSGDQAPRPAPTAVTGTPTAAQLSAAHRAAGSDATLRVLETFFARDGLPPNQKGRLSAVQEATAAEAADPHLIGAAVPVYSLNPEFVTAASAARAPVARMEFAASKAVDADGDTASVWTARVAGQWQVVNIVTGSDETDYAARADADAAVFREPQLNAWYQVSGDRVLPLNEEARASVGPGGTSLARYQRLVHHRYADKMPGSGYDKGGYAGGFDPGAGAGPARSGTAASPVVDSASDGSRTTAGPGTAPIAAGGAALAVAGLAGGLLLRRRRPAEE